MHKANIMKFTDGLCLRVAREVAAENPDIEFDDRIVDNMCMQLVQRPEEYDVLVLPEPLRRRRLRPLRRDDRRARASRPARTSARASRSSSRRTARRRSTPGQNKVNPMAQMLSGMLMLRHLGERRRRRPPRGARSPSVIREGKSVTYDMKPTRDDPTAVGTSEVADAIIEKLGRARAVASSRKVTVVGAGNVGATCAQVLARRDYADVVLVDIKEGLPQGKALDIDQMGAVLGYEPSVIGSNGYDETAGSSVVVITAGVPRQPGMSRDDLVTTNEKIVKSVTEAVVAASPDAILIVVSNPLDAMCHVAKNVSGWPQGARASGMAGILDTARFSTFIAWETGASVKDVTAMVLGGHGDQMVPVVSRDDRRRRPADEARRRRTGSTAMVERTAQGRRRARRAARHLRLVRARRGGGADGRRDHARREARASLHRLPRGRVRDRRPLHGRARSSSARPGSRRSSSST